MSAAGPAGSLEGVLDELHVALGDMRIYGTRHRVTKERVRATWTGLAALMAERGPLALESGADGLRVRGEVVRREDAERSGIGRLLHREGIRSLTLEPGLGLEEFASLLDVLRVNLSLPEYDEESLDSLLWQAGLPHVVAEALSELQEAEVLSGQAWMRGGGAGAAGVIRELMDLRVGDAAQRRRVEAPVTEEAVQRAIARSDLSGLGGETDASRFISAHRAWEQRLNTDSAADHEELERARREVAEETPGDLLAQLVLLLATVAMEGREELPGDRALAFARTAAGELFNRNQPGGLLRLLEGLPRLMQAAPPAAWAVVPQLTALTDQLASPSRVSRLLLELDPALHTDEEGLERLVGWLPDATLEQVLEIASRDRADPRSIWLLEILGAAAQPRFELWLDDLHRQPQERVIALIALLRTLESPVGRARRRELMGHSSRRVREVVLGWYVDDLPAADVEALLPSLVDRHPGVRRAAAEVMARHRPPKAYTWLRLAVQGAAYRTWDAELRRDACVALGAVGGDLGLDVLAGILDQKTSMFGRDDEAADLVAASEGLAAIGSLQARSLLKRGSSSLNSSRRAACQAALKKLERGR